MFHFGMLDGDTLQLMTADADNKISRIDLKNEWQKVAAFGQWPENKELVWIAAQDQHDLIQDITIDALTEKLPNFIRLTAMERSPNPNLLLDLEIKSRGLISREQISAMIDHETFARMAQTGRTVKGGHFIETLINPAAIESVRDAGAYRAIKLKPQFNTKTQYVALSKPAIEALMPPPGPGPA